MNYLKKASIILWIFCANIQAQKDPVKIFQGLYDATIENKVNDFLQNPELELNSIDQNGNTALIIAAEYGYSLIVKYLLIAGANKNHQNKYGHTALSIAQNKNHNILIGLLSSESPELYSPAASVEFADRNKQLRDAIKAEDETLIRKLLYGRDRIQNVNQADDDGITPLMIATKIKSSGNIMRHLLSRGANMNITDNSGNSAFEWAAINDNKKALEFLELKRSEQSELIDKIKKTTNTQAWSKHFKQIIQENSPEIIKAITLYDDKDLTIIKRMIEKDPASILAKGPFGVTPLMIAAALGKVEISNLLIHSGADIHAKDIHSRTAFMYLTLTAAE